MAGGGVARSFTGRTVIRDSREEVFDRHSTGHGNCTLLSRKRSKWVTVNTPYIRWKKSLQCRSWNRFEHDKFLRDVRYCRLLARKRGSSF
jgi:hypothetical protein